MVRRIFVGIACVCALAPASPAGGERLFVAGGDGIYAFEFDPDSGRLSPAILAAKLDAPQALAVHPAGWYLLATGGESGPGEKKGYLKSFFVEPNTGNLHEISRADTGCAGPSLVEVDARRGAVFVTCEEGGGVAGFPLGMDGKLGARAVAIQHEGSSVRLPRQASPHPKGIRLSPDGHHLYVADLGTDEVFVYEFGDEGVLRPAVPSSTRAGEGDGPSRLDFHPSLPLVYLGNELSSRLTVFQRDPQSGALTARQSIPCLPPDWRGTSSGGAVRVHPGGAFVYASHCGHNSIAVLKADQEGYLTVVERQPAGGKMPRHFAIHPSGKWLVAGNQESGNLTVFSIDLQTGSLEPAGEAVPVWSPVCLEFAAAP